MLGNPELSRASPISTFHLFGVAALHYVTEIASFLLRTLNQNDRNDNSNSEKEVWAATEQEIGTATIQLVINIFCFGWMLRYFLLLDRIRPRVIGLRHDSSLFAAAILLLLLLLANGMELLRTLISWVFAQSTISGLQLGINFFGYAFQILFWGHYPVLLCPTDRRVDPDNFPAELDDTLPLNHEVSIQLAKRKHVTRWMQNSFVRTYVFPYQLFSLLYIGFFLEICVINFISEASVDSFDSKVFSIVVENLLTVALLNVVIEKIRYLSWGWLDEYTFAALFYRGSKVREIFEFDARNAPGHRKAELWDRLHRAVVLEQFPYYFDPVRR